MKRSDISGFGFSFGQYRLEVVTVYHIINTIAFSSNYGRKDIKKIELW